MGKVVELLSCKDAPEGSVLDVTFKYTAGWSCISHFDCTTTTNTFKMR